MSESFTVPNVEVVAQAIANRINERAMADMGLVIGYDTRDLSEEFATACAGVFAGNGIEPHLPKRAMPTPITAFAIKRLNAAGGIMITASHNPPEYNGIKFIPEYAGPAFNEITDDIEAKIAGLEPGDIKKGYPGGKELDVIPDYLDHLEQLIDFAALRESGLRVVLDPMYGAGYGIMDVIFAAAGCDLVKTIHNRADPLFGGGSPDPSRERLAELRTIVLESGADLGLAIDGDGDRFGVVDHDGSFPTANEALSLIARHLAKNRGLKGKMVRTVATTHMIDAVASDFGCDLIETPVGFKYIAAEMLSGEVVVGGEESGGLSIGGHIPEKDGIVANLLLAEIMAYEKRPLNEILKDMRKTYGDYATTRLDVHLGEDEKRSLMKMLTESPPKSMDGSMLTDVTTTDGVRYLFENGDWLLARESGTEPLVRVYVESRTKRGLAALERYASSLAGLQLQ